MFISRRVDDTYQYNGILLSNKNQQTDDTQHNWMNLKNIMLNKRRETKKRTYCMLPFK